MDPKFLKFFNKREIITILYGILFLLYATITFFLYYSIVDYYQISGFWSFVVRYLPVIVTAWWSMLLFKKIWKHDLILDSRYREVTPDLDITDFRGEKVYEKLSRITAGIFKSAGINNGPKVTYFIFPDIQPKKASEKQYTNNIIYFYGGKNKARIFLPERCVTEPMESKLTGVLAHEIYHAIFEWHPYIKTLYMGIVDLTKNLQLVLMFILCVKISWFLLPVILFLAPYHLGFLSNLARRHVEFSADLFAAMTGNGYGLISFLELFDVAMGKGRPNKVDIFLADIAGDHPSTPTRNKAIQNYIDSTES